MSPDGISEGKSAIGALVRSALDDVKAGRDPVAMPVRFPVVPGRVNIYWPVLAPLDDARAMFDAALGGPVEKK